MKTERALLGVAIIGLIVTSAGMGAALVAHLASAEPAGLPDLPLRSTVAAEAQARWAYWQFIVSIIGSAGLVVTLVFNARAIELARQANLGTRELTEITSRCYLSIEEAYVRFDTNGLIIVTLKITNMGDTPAEGFGWSVGYTIEILGTDPDLRPSTIVEADPILKAHSHGTITSGDTETFGPRIVGKMAANELSAMRRFPAPGLAITLDIQTEWRDVYDISWRRAYARYVPVKAECFHQDLETIAIRPKVEGTVRKLAARED